MGVKEDSSDIISAWPDALFMRCYTAAEIRALSVKEITSTSIGNQDGDSTEDGLYDPALGLVFKYTQIFFVETFFETFRNF